MRRYVFVAVTMSVAAAAWWALQTCLPGGSERFHLLVPPTVLTCGLILFPQLATRRKLFTSLGYIAFLTILCTLYQVAFAAAITPDFRNDPLTGLRVAEIARMVYFIVSLSLLLNIPLQLVRKYVRRFLDRAMGGDVPGTKQPLWRQQLRRTACEFLLVPLVLPYVIGALNVHRCKVSNPTAPAALAGRDYQDVTFKTTDGLTIRGWFISAPGGDSSRTMIVCHGLGGNRTGFLPLVSLADAIHANALFFDFRGHGDSDGHTVTFGYRERLDVLAAVDYLRSERAEQAREIVGLGISMGTSALIHAAADAEPPLNAVIVDSGFAVAGELTDKLLAIFPAPARPCIAALGMPLACLEAGCSLGDVRPIDHIANIRAPLLIIHNEGDGLIPVDHGQRLYEKAVEPKSVWITSTPGHGCAFNDQDEYIRRVKGTLAEPATKRKHAAASVHAVALRE